MYLKTRHSKNKSIVIVAPIIHTRPYPAALLIFLSPGMNVSILSFRLERYHTQMDVNNNSTEIHVRTFLNKLNERVFKI